MVEKKAKDVMNELIKKQMVILGPGVAIGKAKNIPGLSVDDSGNVTAVKGSDQKALDLLVEEYAALSGQITRSIVESIVK
ncbi:MAG: hypothetical protein Q8P30_01615 [Candidatus Uhrbacteria bacterium]|nr:hypothetical protein [Candidatus Uhrbacteria bacterium]